MPSETRPCQGIAGRLFGHKMRGRYDTEERMPDSWRAKNIWDFDLPRVLNTIKERTRTYRGDVCERCGWCPVPGEVSDAE